MFPSLSMTMRDLKMKSAYTTAYKQVQAELTVGIDMLMALELERRFARYLRANKGYARTSYAQYEDARLPAIWMMLEICTTKLESGAYHFWWGDVNDEGKQLQHVVDNCLTSLVRYGEINRTESKRIKAGIRTPVLTTS